jgi:hypothetical protein
MFLEIHISSDGVVLLRGLATLLELGHGEMQTTALDVQTRRVFWFCSLAPRGR